MRWASKTNGKSVRGIWCNFPQSRESRINAINIRKSRRRNGGFLSKFGEARWGRYIDVSKSRRGYCDKYQIPVNMFAIAIRDMIARLMEPQITTIWSRSTTHSRWRITNTTQARTRAGCFFDRGWMVRLDSRSLNIRPKEQQFAPKIRSVGGIILSVASLNRNGDVRFYFIFHCMVIGETSSVLADVADLPTMCEGRQLVLWVDYYVGRLSRPGPAWRCVWGNWEAGNSGRRLISTARPFIWENPLWILLWKHGVGKFRGDMLYS